MVIFTTTGEVEEVKSADKVIGYSVGRKNNGPIRLTTYSDQYWEKDVTMGIDSRGSLWIKQKG